MSGAPVSWRPDGGDLDAMVDRVRGWGSRRTVGGRYKSFIRLVSFSHAFSSVDIVMDAPGSIFLTIPFILFRCVYLLGMLTASPKAHDAAMAR